MAKPSRNTLHPLRTKKGENLQANSLRGRRSALVHLYGLWGRIIPKEFELKGYLRGKKRQSPDPAGLSPAREPDAEVLEPTSFATVEKRFEVLLDMVRGITPAVTAAVSKMLDERAIQTNGITHTELQEALGKQFAGLIERLQFSQLQQQQTPPASAL